MQNLLDLTGKIAIVTGASSGMGAAITKLFAEQGATVVALARRKELLDELAAQNSNIVPYVADVTKNIDIEDVVKFTTEKFGKIDILVNNAGIMDDMLPLDELSDEMWDKVLSVNTAGVMKMSRAVVKEMLKKKSGAIVNISSLGGLYGGRAGTAYTASKHATVGLTRSTAFMYAKEGIRCNAICPGGVATEIAQNSMKNPSKSGLAKTMVGMPLNPRVAEAGEIANVALFLASGASSVLNGAIIAADSGWSAY